MKRIRAVMAMLLLFSIVFTVNVQAVTTAKISSKVSNITASKSKKISITKAIDLLIKRLTKHHIIRKKDKNLGFVYSGRKIRRGKKYYVIDVFYDRADHISTIGYYGVEIHGHGFYDFTLNKPLK